MVGYVGCMLGAWIDVNTIAQILFRHISVACEKQVYNHACDLSTGERWPARTLLGRCSSMHESVDQPTRVRMNEPRKKVPMLLLNECAIQVIRTNSQLIPGYLINPNTLLGLTCGR
jgi:hypothetical protein